MEVMEDIMYPADAGKYGKTKPDVVGSLLLAAEICLLAAKPVHLFTDGLAYK